MTDDDRQPFAEGLFTLTETFNEPASDTKIEAYFSALREFDIDDVLRAMRHALQHAKFCPRPAELREAIEGSVDDGADAAWGDVLREIRRVGYVGTPTLDDRTLRAVRELWGSWQRLCETLPVEGPELIGWIKQFKAAYASGARTEQRALTMGDVHPTVRAFIRREQRRLS